MVATLSDGQAKEVVALFRFFDRDRDGLISPRSATKLCEQLGFHLDPARSKGEAGSMPVSSQDLLDWVDDFMGQCQRNEELRLTQRMALLRSCDVFAGPSHAGHKVSREALEKFLATEEHAVQPAELDALLEECGTDDQLSRRELRELISRKSKSKPPAKAGTRAAPKR